MNNRKTNLRLECPHCRSFARVRNSTRITPTLRNALVECTNVECNWRGHMTIHFEHTLSPSETPDPNIRLPLSRDWRNRHVDDEPTPTDGA